MFDKYLKQLEEKTKKRVSPMDTEIYNVSLNPELLKRLLRDNQSMSEDEIKTILDNNMKTLLEMYDNNILQGVEAMQLIGLFNNPIVQRYVKYYIMDCTNPYLNKIVTNIYYIILMTTLESKQSQDILNNVIEIIKVSNMNNFIQLHQIDMNVNVTYIAILIGMTTHYTKDKINTYINQLYNEGEIKMAAEYMRFIDYMM